MADVDSGGPADAAIELHTEEPDTPVIRVWGDIDMSNADRLEAAVREVTDRPVERIVFDLAGLRFMDSAGIAVLINAASRASAVRLRTPSPAVRRVIEASGLTDVLPMEQ